MTELVTGQNLPWPGPRLTVRLHGKADLSALLLGADALVRDDSDLVFYNAPDAGGVTWRAEAQDDQRITVELGALAPAIDRVRLLVSVDDDQPALGPGAVTVDAQDGAGTEISYAPTGFDGERCLIWFEAYRRGGAWKVRAVGQGWKAGLAAALSAHGIAVEATEQPAQQPVQRPAETPSAPPTATPIAPLPPTAGPTQPSRPTSPASGAPTPGPDDDTVSGALRAIRSLRQDVSQVRRAHRTAVEYAADKLAAAQDQARTGNAASLAAVQVECMTLVAQADERYDREAAALGEELVAEEFAMPLPLARLDSFDWETFSSSGSDAPQGQSGIDTHDRTGDIVRLGSLYPPERVPLRLPMPHAWGGRPLVWVDARDRAPVGAAWVHGLIARMMALTPPGGFEVQLVDLDGSLATAFGALGPNVAADITRHRSPAELAGFVDQLAHHCDLAKMAVESRIPDALDDVRDGARHLVVLGGWPHGYDERTQNRIIDCLEWGYPLSLQFVVLCDDSELGRELPAEHPTQRLLSKSLLLEDGPHPGLIDDTGVEWCFDPEITDTARGVAARITANDRRR